MRKLLFAVVLGLALVASAGAAFADCAFEDNNDNGVLDAGDVLVPDAAWLGGTPFTTTKPFVVPAGCNHTLLSAPAPLYGVSVTAPRITWRGSLVLGSPGGTGVELIATGPKGVLMQDGSIESGGINKHFSPTGRAVMVVAQAGPCKFLNSTLRGNRPIGSTNVGINCAGTVTFSGATVTGALVNIQSLTGKIDAGVCPTTTPSRFAALNGPLIVISKKDLDVSGDTLTGRYRVTLGAEDGNIVTVGSAINNGSPAAGGAFISLFANPATVVRAQVDHEDFLGPSVGSVNVQGACYASANDIQYGTGSTLLGTPSASCAQLADFVAVMNGIY